MIVCIAEKPSVGKDIAKVLGATQDHRHYMEGNGYQVTWTFGHLCELKEPHEYSPLWKAWSLSSLPMIPPRFGIKLKNDKGIEEQFRIIERLMQAADMIINCGDAGQEGELIQRWVMQKAGARCPVKRLWISSLTEEAIREGFNNLKDQSEYQPLYEAGLSRAIGDWTLGMNATRLYTLKYAQGRQVLSIGRVQTPTLALIVNRQQEIEHFKPEPYWVLTTVYRNTTFTAVLEQDEEKGRICERSGIRLIRLREPGLPRISRCVFAVELEDFGDRAFEAAIAELFHYLKISEFDVDIARDRRAILETYRNFTARAWDRAYQELYGYYREHGTLSVPADLLSSDGINLAWWFYTQRGAYQDNELTALQIKKLESLGISWAPFEERWEYMYDLAAAYVRQHGDLMIPHDYITDQQERLGGWLARQRELYRRKELEPRRIRRLEQLGIQWEPKKMRQRRYLEAARAYQKAEGSLEVPFNYITKDGLRLGEWLAAQRKRYRAGRLDGQMIQELEGLGIRWEPYSSRWEEMFLLAQAYYEKHGDLCVPYDYVTGKDDALGRWIFCQRRKSRGTAAGTRLTEEQKEKLDAIGMVWDPYTEKWMKKYRAAEKFYQAEGHLKVPADFITEDGTKLGMWLASQRQAMRGNPNYLMNPERKRLLDAIGMDWSLKRTSPNARRRA